MRKLVFCILILAGFSLTLGCSDAGSSNNSNTTPTATSQLAFIREAVPSGSGVAEAPSRLEAWTLRGHQALKTRQGTGIAPLVTDMDPGTDSVIEMNNDGTGEKTLVNQAGWFYSVQLGFDGSKGVFSAQSLGYTQVYMANMSQLPNGVTQLTSDAEDHGYPQLSKVVFMKWVDAIVQTAVMNASGGAETVISTPTVWTFAPAFTPDGKIIFVDEYTGQVKLMNADGTGMKTITTPASGSHDAFPRVSADGKTVVFDREGDIYTQALDGSNLKQLTITGLNWDARFVNNKIVFVSWVLDAGNNELFSMNPDGSNLKRLTNNSVDDYFFWD